jgi:hypothetical protein
VRLRATRGQAPDDVARAAVKVARRWAHRPETQLITRAELAPYAPKGDGPELDGAWLPWALYRWARSLTFWREPAGPGKAGELVLALPWVVLVEGGDCDDIAAAVATMAAAVGTGAAVGRLFPTADPSQAHIVAAVRATWRDRGPWFVIDPQRAGGPSRAELWPGVRWFPV